MWASLVLQRCDKVAISTGAYFTSRHWRWHWAKESGFHCISLHLISLHISLIWFHCTSPHVIPLHISSFDFTAYHCIRVGKLLLLFSPLLMCYCRWTAKSNIWQNSILSQSFPPVFKQAHRCSSATGKGAVSQFVRRMLRCELISQSVYTSMLLGWHGDWSRLV